MKRVFADTSYFIAMVTPNEDAHHAAAAFSLGSSRLVTTAWVMTELGAHLSAPKNRRLFLKMLRSFQNHPDVEFLSATDGQFFLGTQLYEERSDKRWSLVDCISFAIMRENRITDALTTDHHFVQAGFTALLPVSRS